MCENQPHLNQISVLCRSHSQTQQDESLDLNSTIDENLVDLDPPGYNVRHYPPESNEVMSYSMFDDNGNPMNEQDLKDESEVEDERQLNYAQMHQQHEEEATFFINAAAVSDEEDGVVYMAGSRSGDIKGLGPTTATDTQSTFSVQKEVEGESSILFERIKSSRVPISRSFPDIIQTTMSEKLYGISNPNSKNTVVPTKESLKAAAEAATLKNDSDLSDSLEELDIKSGNSSQEKNEPQKTKLEPQFNVDDATNLMASSMVGGISCEKPPDSWTIDFNSLSTDETFSECEPKTSNSLAYFLDINEAVPPTDTNKHADDDPKKIFSLFIDIGDTKQQNQSQSRNIMNTSYSVEKKIPNPPPEQVQGYGQKQQQTGKSGNYMGMSTVSNRSSLHVATHDLEDTMFSSSILSSMEASGPDDDMESCLKLGMDLLRMFQEGINTDVQIVVNGRVIRAHKCILASRSQYFAALLSGNRVEKTGNTIRLDDYSFSVVQFTLYHIYSGTNEIPDSIDLIELVSLTDLLGLEGLKEIISSTIKAKYAHNFHRPCSTCIIGVIQFFPISISYGMDELSRKMTKWMSKHFVRIWPTKAFASMGDDLIEKCLSYTINHLSGENLIDITLGCDQLLNTMPNIKWAETIFKIVNQLTQACVEFIGQDLCEVLQSQRFLIFGKGQAWNISRIEHTFLEGLRQLKPDDACLSHVCLSRLIELGTETFDEAFVDFLIMLQCEVEKYLLSNASRAVLSRNWERLSEGTRKKICSTGFLVGSKSSSSKTTPSAPKKQSSSGRTDPKPSRPTSSSTRPTAPTSWKPGQKMAESQIIEAKPRKILSPGDAAKVASVRPMERSHIQQQNVYSSRQTEKSTKQGQQSRAKSPGSSRIASKPLSQHKPAAQSFDNSPTSANTKPVTPTSRPNSFPYRNTKLSPRFDDKPETPTKPVFLTNSEKAKAVSKPNLKMRSARSNSISNSNPDAPTSYPAASASVSHSRQSSVGSMAAASNLTTAQPRTPNLSQPSRYASTAGGTRRNPVEKVIQSVSAMPKSPLPKGRVNSANAATRKAPAIASSSKTTPNTSRQVSVENKKTKPAGKAAPANNGKPVARKLILDFDSGSDSDTLMTKSNIEDKPPTTGGEQRPRTLAEIGRSSTFSKDEPTVIGKIDFGLDMPYTQL